MKQTLHEHMGGYLLSHHTRHPADTARTGIAVTISREAGAGGLSVARRLAENLDARQPSGRPAWRVFDHNLIDEALRQHRMPAHLGAYMAEDVVHLVPDTVEDLLGIHPPATEMIRKLAGTMVNLARRGNVILVGRGGNLATARVPGAIHVRLVAPRIQRVRHIEELRGLTHADAEAFVTKTDRARKRFVSQNFRAKIDDPTGYDLVLNTGRLGFDKAAEFIGALVADRFPPDAAM